MPPTLQWPTPVDVERYGDPHYFVGKTIPGDITVLDPLRGAAILEIPSSPETTFARFYHISQSVDLVGFVWRGMRLEALPDNNAGKFWQEVLQRVETIISGIANSDVLLPQSYHEHAFTAAAHYLRAAVCKFHAGDGPEESGETYRESVDQFYAGAREVSFALTMLRESSERFRAQNERQLDWLQKWNEAPAAPLGPALNVGREPWVQHWLQRFQSALNIHSLGGIVRGFAEDRIEDFNGTYKYDYNKVCITRYGYEALVSTYALLMSNPKAWNSEFDWFLRDSFYKFSNCFTFYSNGSLLAAELRKLRDNWPWMKARSEATMRHETYNDMGDADRDPKWQRFSRGPW